MLCWSTCSVYILTTVPAILHIVIVIQHRIYNIWTLALCSTVHLQIMYGNHKPMNKHVHWLEIAYHVTFIEELSSYLNEYNLQEGLLSLVGGGGVLIL